MHAFGIIHQKCTSTGNFLLSLQQSEEVVINGTDYGNVVCSDVDLKCLSAKLHSKCSISSIGHCLCLNQGEIQEVEEDETHDAFWKMNSLLCKWRHNCNQATWGILMHHFKSLKDESLVEDIRQIALSQKPKDQGMVELATCQPKKIDFLGTIISLYLKTLFTM